MELYITYVLFIAGLVMIVKGSDWFVDSAVWGAKISGIPEAVIGATIISICTTLPETIVAATASFEGESNMAVGNALGSIAANTGLILAIMFIFSKQTAKPSKAYLSNGNFLVFILLAAWAGGLYWGQITRVGGAFLIGLFFFFIYRNFRNVQRSAGNRPLEEEQSTCKSSEQFICKNSEKSTLSNRQIATSGMAKNVMFFIVGIVLVIFGAQLVVNKGILIAESLGIPTIVIAIVFTSLGTSLPELITAVSAIKKGAIQLGMGNIIGANILNLLQVIGVSAIIAPIDLTLDKSILYFQFPAGVIFCGIAIYLNRNGTKKSQKLSGFLLLALYLVFLLVNILREATPIIGNWIF